MESNPHSSPPTNSPPSAGAFSAREDDPNAALPSEYTTTGPARSDVTTPQSTESADSPEPLFSDGPQPVDPRQIPVDRIASWIVAGVFIGGGLVSLIIVLIGSWPPDWITGLVFAGWILLTVFFVWLAHCWPVLTHRHLRYVVTERGLEIRKGVIWRSIISLPQARVQHTDVVQGPLQRRYGIATLVAHTAGTKNSTVSLEGLSRERAMQIRDFLLQGGPDDAV